MGLSPSERQKPSASSSSWPGVRIVTATGRPPIRISSGSSTATASRSLRPSGSRTTPTVEEEYGGAGSIATRESVLLRLRLSAPGRVRQLAGRAAGDDVVEDRAEAVDRRGDVAGRQVVRPTFDRLGDLMRCQV